MLCKCIHTSVVINSPASAKRCLQYGLLQSIKTCCQSFRRSKARLERKGAETVCNPPDSQLSVYDLLHITWFATGVARWRYVSLFIRCTSNIPRTNLPLVYGLMPVAQISEAAFIKLYKSNIIPLRVACVLNPISSVVKYSLCSVAGLTWVIHDYCELDS